MTIPLTTPQPDRPTPEELAEQIEVVRQWLSDAMDMMFVGVQMFSMATLAMQQIVSEEARENGRRRVLDDGAEAG